MINSKTIKVINKYYSIIENPNPTNEEKDFVYHLELEIAKAMLSEFDDSTLHKLGKILLIETPSTTYTHNSYI